MEARIRTNFHGSASRSRDFTGSRVKADAEERARGREADRRETKVKGRRQKERIVRGRSRVICNWAAREWIAGVFISSDDTRRESRKNSLTFLISNRISRRRLNRSVERTSERARTSTYLNSFASPERRREDAPSFYASCKTFAGY